VEQTRYPISEDGVPTPESKVLVPSVTRATMHSPSGISLQSSIRTLDTETGDAYRKGLQPAIESAAAKFGARQQTEFPRYGRFPATRNDASMAAAGRPALNRAMGIENVIDAGAFPASEDFPWLTKDGSPPSLFLLMGVRPEGGANPEDPPNQNHTAGFGVDDEALPAILRAVGLLMSDMSARCAGGWKPTAETAASR